MGSSSKTTRLRYSGTTCVPELMKDVGLEEVPAFIATRPVPQAVLNGPNYAGVEEVELRMTCFPDADAGSPCGQELPEQRVRQYLEVA